MAQRTQSGRRQPAVKSDRTRSQAKAKKRTRQRADRSAAQLEPEMDTESEQQAHLESEKVVAGPARKVKKPDKVMVGDVIIEEVMVEPVGKVKKPRKTVKPKPSRMRVVWGVFSSLVQCIQTFPYPQKKEAETLAAKLTAEKKSPYFVQPVKEPIAEEPPAG